MSINTTGTILGISLVIVIIGGGWYFYTKQNENVVPVMSHDQTNMTTGMRVEDNAVVVQDQKPGNTLVVSQVYLASPGYVVIHDMANKIIGSSTLLPVGTSNNVIVQLSRPSKDGDMFNAMLHNEQNNNTSFEDSVDMPVTGKLGGIIMGMFNISSQAGGNASTSM